MINFIAPNYRLKSPSETLDNPQGDWLVVKSDMKNLKNDREKQIRSLNRKHGDLCWRFAWQIDKDKYVPYKDAVKVYEEGYEQHLKKYPEKIEYLSNNAENVYDNDVSNIRSGTNYYIQENHRTHLQDISIRRIMAKHGFDFNGNKLIKIRSTSPDETGASLSPLNVPFHRPNIVRGGDELDREVKVEDFWKLNRVLQVSDALIRLPIQEREKCVEAPDNFL